MRNTLEMLARLPNEDGNHGDWYEWAYAEAQRFEPQKWPALETIISVSYGALPDTTIHLLNAEELEKRSMLLMGPIGICWRGIDGHQNPSRALEQILHSKTAILRSNLLCALIRLKDFASDPDHKEMRWLAHFDWDSPEATDPSVFEDPTAFASLCDLVQDWFAGTALDAHRSSGFGRPKLAPDERVSKGMYGVALHWFDKALSTQDMDRRLNIVGAAVSAMHLASVYDGLCMAEAAARRAAIMGGTKGGKIRHQKTDELKRWAVEQAKNSNTQPRVLARQLTNMLPKHLVNASADPERLIYETLLALRRPKPLPVEVPSRNA